jgi:uncharacterized protein YabE (DUF348 family)
MAKGAKEIDIAATLEHIRDQRMNMVKTKVNNKGGKGGFKGWVSLITWLIRDQRRNMVKTKVNNKGKKGGLKGWVSLITWLIRDQRRNMVKTKVNNKGKKGVGITDNLVD